jgi:hypothetical protein
MLLPPTHLRWTSAWSAEARIQEGWQCHNLRRTDAEAHIAQLTHNPGQRSKIGSRCMVPSRSHSIAILGSATEHLTSGCRTSRSPPAPWTVMAGWPPVAHEQQGPWSAEPAPEVSMFGLALASRAARYAWPHSSGCPHTWCRTRHLLCTRRMQQGMCWQGMDTQEHSALQRLMSCCCAVLLTLEGASSHGQRQRQSLQS